VGRHSLTVREKDGDKDLVGEFIFYVVKPPNRGLSFAFICGVFALML
jgi:hypothetical protein